MNLYCTSDDIGLATGGGIVTYYESSFMALMGPTIILGRQQLPKPEIRSPFIQDAELYKKIMELQQTNNIIKFNKALFYSGSFPASIQLLKHQGTKIAHTCAAHDPKISRQEHVMYGVDYDASYPHLSDANLNLLYTKCFRDVDLVICPSTHSASIMKAFGCQKIKVIPHGCTLPPEVVPMPKKFTIGYLGQVGPDKGLKYLLTAWNILKDSEIDLKIRCSDKQVLKDINNKYGGHPADIDGRVENTSELYNNISVYVSSSCTEGFGIPVLEAMAHGRPVICSKNTGASDLVHHGHNGFIVPSKDPYAIADCVLELKRNPELVQKMGQAAREIAKDYTWDKIGQQYIETMRSL